MPLPLLAVPAIIAGAASVGSSLVDALGKRLTKAERARLKELEERKAAGTLGYTDEEKAAIDAEVKNPLRQAMREEFLRSRAGTLTDAGTVARTSLAREDATVRALADAGEQVTAMNLDEKRRQDAELTGLQAARRDARAGAGTAVAQGAFAAAQAGGDVANVLGQAKADRELFRALYPDGSEAEAAEFERFTGAKTAPRVETAPPAAPTAPLRVDLEAFRMWKAAGSPADVAPFGSLPPSQIRALEAASSLRPKTAPVAPVGNPVDADFFRALEGTDADAESYYQTLRESY